MAAFIGSPSLLLNHLILKDDCEIQQTGARSRRDVGQALWGCLGLKQIISLIHNLCGANMKMTLLAAFFLFAFAIVLQAQTSGSPTVAEAEAFMNKAEARLIDLHTEFRQAGLSVKVNQANWVHDNFITDDTEALAAAANDEITAVTSELVEQAKRFDGVKMPADLARKFLLLKLSLTAPAPKDPALRKEMTTIGVSLDSDYGKGKYCRKNGECLDITAIEKIMARSRGPEEPK